jgi:hypothetical protein
VRGFSRDGAPTGWGALRLSLDKDRFSDKTLAAHFDARGQKLSGSEEIVVERIPSDHPGVCWFHVRPVKRYTFLRFPVVESGAVEVHGYDDINPDARFFRWAVSLYLSGGLSHANHRLPTGCAC